jgi:hypothetical protein
MYHEEDQEEFQGFSHKKEHMTPAHRWQVKFIIGLITILGCFIGLILSHIGTFNIWNYWRISIGCFTLMSLGLCLYTRKQERPHHASLWQELLLWLSVYLAGGIFSLFVHAQVFSNFQASLALLTCLSMALLIAGILIESSFIFTGIALALFAAGAAYLKTYLYKVLLPLALVFVLGLFLFSYFKKNSKY